MSKHLRWPILPHSPRSAPKWPDPRRAGAPFRGEIGAASTKYHNGRPKRQSQERSSVMKKLFNRFVRDERGAVTVDWVVMTAAIVGLGVAVTVAVSPGMSQLAGKISDSVGSIQVNLGGAEAGNGEEQEITGIGADPDRTGFDYFHGEEMAELGAFGGDEWVAAGTALIAADAPYGYNFDTPRLSANSDLPVFASNDGQSVSIGGVVYPAGDFGDDDVWYPDA
jgi:Flp pilus assembly pilin Flp